MATESILTATFGSPGSGKSYCRVRWLVEDFLVNNPSGLYITNIPLCVDVIAEYVAKRLSVRGEDAPTSDDIKSRLVVIPDDTIIEWEKLNSASQKELAAFDHYSFPPVRYLQSFDLSGAHIAIDEFHKIFGKKSPKALKALWNDWFAEIRKTGCTFEAITQSYGQMNEEYLDKCATRLELINHSDSKDPFFRIKMGDWYELKAGLFKRPVVQRVTCRETMRGASDSGRLCWKPTGNSETFLITPEYFKFYDSFRNSSGSSGSRKSPSEIYGRGVWKWFFRRNILTLAWRVLLFCFVAWLLLGGGFVSGIRAFMSSMAKVQKANSVDQISRPSAGVQPNLNSPQKMDRNLKVPSAGQGGAAQVPAPPPEDLTVYKPCLFFGDEVYLRNCVRLYVGYVFKVEGGKYDKRKVERIDPRERCYFLDDGTCILMY